MSKYKVITEYKSLNSNDYNRGEKPCDTLTEAKKFFEERKIQGIEWMRDKLKEEGFMWDPGSEASTKTYYAYMSPTKRFTAGIAFYNNSYAMSEGLFTQLYKEELDEAENKRAQEKQLHTYWPGYEEGDHE